MSNLNTAPVATPAPAVVLPTVKKRKAAVKSEIGLIGKIVAGLIAGTTITEIAKNVGLEPSALSGRIKKMREDAAKEHQKTGEPNLFDRIDKLREAAGGSKVGQARKVDYAGMLKNVLAGIPEVEEKPVVKAE